MRNFFGFLLFIVFAITSCEPEEEIRQEREIKFLVSKPAGDGTGSGRVASAEPTALLVTVKDASGTTTVDRRILELYKFGDTFLSLPLTLSISGEGQYKLTEFLVVDAAYQVIYATPREQSEMAHLVTDALDIEFAISENEITLVKPQVLVVDANSEPVKFGYGQFDFEVVKSITTVFSSFIRSVNNFELTDSHLKVEGLTDAAPGSPALWTYETDLAPKANIIGLKHAPFYRLTATKAGYRTWRRVGALVNDQKTEILFEKEGTLEFERVWSKHYGGSNFEYPNKWIRTTDGGVLVAGSTFSGDHDITDRTGEQTDVWVLKLDASGAVQWSKTYTQSFNDHPFDEATSVVELNNGSYLITVNSSKATKRVSGWLLKIDREGNVVWKKSDEGYNFYASTTAVSGSDHVMLIGYMYTTPLPYNAVVKIAREIDGSGNVIWEKRIFEEGFPHELQIRKEAGSYFITNRSQYLFKLNAYGETEWKAEVPPLPDHDRKFTVCMITPDGFLVLGTETNWQSTEDRHTMIAAKFTKNGEFVWKKKLSTLGRKGFFMDVATTSFGNIRVVGGSEASNANTRDAWILEVSTDGEVVRQAFLHGSYTVPMPDCYFQSIIPTGADEYIVSGLFRDTGNDLPGSYGLNDAWAMKIKF